ncbi:hypothetical protein BH23PLA1_BH23PLA1_20860 [soil metagenome]
MSMHISSRSMSKRLALVLGLGIALMSAGRADAQIFNPYGGGYGYGYGPYGGSGFGGGYAPFASGAAGYNMATRWGAMGYGMSSPGPVMAAPIGIWGGLTPGGTAAMTQQTMALNASRYNQMQSQATLNYQAANMFNQMAARTMLENYGQAKYGADYGNQRYPIRGAGPRLSPGEVGPDADAAVAEGDDPRMVRPGPIFGDDGRVLWPESTPVSPELDEKRLAAAEAIQDVAQKSRRDGRAPVSAVVDAKEKLEDFGRDAVQNLQEQDNSEAAEEIARFVQNVDYALSNFVNTTPRMDSTVKAPPDAPKTGGDVLKESIQSDRQDNAGTQPQAVQPQGGPRD